MSDSFLFYVPTDPGFQPTPHSAEAAKALLSEYFPDAESVEAEFFDSPEFFDGASNWSGVTCHVCGADAGPWWTDAMEKAAASQFDTLTLTSPCCKNHISLNDLNYGWPTAFGRFALEAENPDSEGLPHEQLALLEATLGCTLKEIPAHV
ncbi:MAG: hypothetical protein HY836_18625 [Aquabacterium sp.]|uniref:hypothetical protein n=1 Tax=Aquabacterium sp. TaxID=1872578 RepID=UPI0025B99C42|nr:hypothetical protein [Aquabacterium sp.]MBI5927607.1 hypothetical protein [Aquabacterium sp.]